MKIKAIEIKNIRSFGNKVHINLGSRLNIMIGPNAGGKSNFLDILNISLNYFLFHPWRMREERDGFGGVSRRYYENRREIYTPIQKYLDKHFYHGTESQEFNIIISLNQSDIENIRVMISYFDRLNTYVQKF